MPVDNINTVKKLSGFKSVKPIDPVDFKKKFSAITNVTPDNITTQQVEVHNLCQSLRRSRFQYYTTDVATGREVMIHYQKDSETLNPIDPNEALIQALRFYEGMLLIAQNLQSKQQTDFINKLSSIYQQFTELMPTKDQNDLAFLFAKNCASLLSDTFNINDKKALHMLSCAKDLAQLTYPPTTVVTITKVDKRHIVETARSVKIDEKSYAAALPRFKEQANYFCGLKGSWFWQRIWNWFFPKETWVDRFFNNNENVLKHIGRSMPSSLRISAIPANLQKITRAIYDENNQILDQDTNYRLGIPTPFMMKSSSSKEQIEAAKQQLKTVLGLLLKQAINDYQEKYASLIDPNKFEFMIDVTSLLSPWRYESYLYHLGHTDNNEEFVKQKSAAIAALEKDQKFINSLKLPKGVSLIWHKGNTAVNDLVKKYPWLIVDYSETEKIIAFNDRFFKELETKLGSDELKNLIKSYNQLTIQAKTVKSFLNHEAYRKLLKGEYPNTNLNKQLQREIALRMQATLKLRLILTGQLYQNVPTDLRNIFKVALEMLAKGSAALKIYFCKSARDRRTMVEAAMNVMREKPELIDNPVALLQAMIHDLQRGHAFRALIDHVAIVKVDDVRKGGSKEGQQTVSDDTLNNPYTNFLPEDLLSAINGLKKLVKTLKKMPKMNEGKLRDGIGIQQGTRARSPSSTGQMRRELLQSQPKSQDDENNQLTEQQTVRNGSESYIKSGLFDLQLQPQQTDDEYYTVRNGSESYIESGLFNDAKIIPILAC